MRGLLFSLATLLLVGCTVTVESDGDDRFLRGKEELTWRKGRTTTLEVARALGPPDKIERQANELWFRYRYRDLRSKSMRLSAYGLNFFNYKDADAVNTSLIVAFDEGDKLLYYGISDGPMIRKMLFVDY